MLDFNEARVDGQRTVSVQTTVPRVQETVKVTPLVTEREVRTTDVGKRPEDWSWEDLRNYVIRQIETFHGDFPKDPLKLRGIFMGFHRRHGADAGPIAVAAFDLHRGYWKGAPISVTRFCQGSDAWFAEPIKNSLRQG